MEHFFLQIQVEICAQMHIRVKLLEGMQMQTILKSLGGYSQIIGKDISPHPRVSAPLPIEYSLIAFLKISSALFVCTLCLGWWGNASTHPPSPKIRHSFKPVRIV